MKRGINKTTKYLVIAGVFLLIANLTMGTFIALESRKAMKDLIGNRMLDISNTAAAMLDGDALDSVQAEDVDTPEYQAILKTLTYYQDNINLKYIYCIRDMGDKNFVFTVDPTVDDPGEFGEPIVYTDALYEASKGVATVDTEPYEDRWGRFYSAYSPVFNSNGEVAGIVAVDFDANWYDKQVSDQIRTIIIISLMSLSFGAIIIITIATRFRKRFRRLYKELNKLSDGIETLANEISDNADDDNTELLHDDGTNDETENDDIAIIGNRINNLEQYMKAQIGVVRAKAYKDGLTGLENRTAYHEYVERLEAHVRKDMGDFTVAIFDINGLKNINDSMGHEQGDETIIKAGALLRKTFPDERIFRIGGDEFVVLFKSKDEEMKALFEAFDKNIDVINEGDDEADLAMSKGYAIYDKKVDEGYKDTFDRADNAMYEDKKAYYQRHGDRRRH